MLFNPTLKLDIIREDDFSAQIAHIEDELSKYSTAGEFASFDGCSISYEYFNADNSKASIVLLHGFTEFYKKLYEMAWYFLHMGYNVFLYDQRGHGLSGRSNKLLSTTHVDTFDDYVKDLELFMDKIVVPNSEDKPVHILGHSMGGAVVTMFLMNNTHKVDRVILSSPMICPKTHGFPNFLVDMIAVRYGKKEGWSKRFPHSSDFNPNPNFYNSSDSSKARFEHNLKHRIENEHYQNSSFTNGWIHQALKIKKHILNPKNIAKIKNKTLLISAQDDKVVYSSLHMKLAKKMSDCTLISIPGAKHTVYTATEPLLKMFYDTLFEFLK